jgi:hypothetical protein
VTLLKDAAEARGVVILLAMTTYQSAYARLIFVSGLERHRPRGCSPNSGTTSGGARPPS